MYWVWCGLQFCLEFVQVLDGVSHRVLGGLLVGGVLVRGRGRFGTCGNAVGSCILPGQSVTVARRPQGAICLREPAGTAGLGAGGMTSVNESLRLSALLLVLSVASTSLVASLGPPPNTFDAKGQAMATMIAAASPVSMYLIIIYLSVWLLVRLLPLVCVVVYDDETLDRT